jgi:hypothetical protein
MGQQAWIILLTLVPIRFRVKGMPFPNDGMQAIDLLRRRHAVDTHPTYLELLRRYSRDGNPQITAASHRIIRQFTMGEMWVVPAARREVVEALRRELATTGMSVPERLLVLDLLISIGLISDDAEMRPHLDDWAGEAGELGPDVISVIGSRAAVVVARGRYREGKAMLEAVAAKIAVAPSDANRVDDIYIRLFIARAEAGLGDASAARRRLAEVHKALKTEPRLAHLRPLAARIEREVNAAPDQAAASTSISASRSGMSTITS